MRVYTTDNNHLSDPFGYNPYSKHLYLSRIVSLLFDHIPVDWSECMFFAFCVYIMYSLSYIARTTVQKEFSRCNFQKAKPLENLVFSRGFALVHHQGLEPWTP